MYRVYANDVPTRTGIVGRMHFRAVILVCSLVLSCGEDDGPPKENSGLGPGEPCLSASECQVNLICPLSSAGDDAKVCTDPMDGAFDDGTGPDLTQAKRWARKRVGEWESLAARCNDGSPYAYYVTPGMGDGVNKWLLFHKGGSSCSNEADCALRWLQQPQFMRGGKFVNSEFSPGPIMGEDAGLFARDRPSNPFANWNFVYIEYCSSDEFAGTSMPEDNDSHLWFRGNVNTSAAIDELLDGLDLSSIGTSITSLSDATEVVVGGGSAGAAGARNNMDWIADKVRKRSPAVRVRGFSDSLYVPAVHPEQYETTVPKTAYWKAVLDGDCVQAHPNSPSLCSNGMHLLNGRGPADWLGEADTGHLGTASSTESYAVEGHYAFMAQFDTVSTTPIGRFGLCIRDGQCNADSDCTAGQGCFLGACLEIQPCEPTVCTPDDVPCSGIGGAPTCFGEVATHANECDENDPTTCGNGETCIRGFCVEDLYLGCEEDSDCPDTFACARRICTRGARSVQECNGLGEIFEPDTKLCSLALGCSATSPCGSGYSCLPANRTPLGEALAWGIRQGLGSHGPGDSVFVPNSTTHTATLGAKFYGRALPKILGQTFSEALSDWMAEPSTAVDHISLSSEMPLLLWSSGVSELSLQFANRTSGTGCADDALGFLLCDIASGCTPATAIAIASVGDSGTSMVLGPSPAAPVQLMLTVVANPSCTNVSLTPEKGAYLELTHQVPASGTANTVRLSIPSAPFGSAPQTLFIGADGATYLEKELATLVGARRM